MSTYASRLIRARMKHLRQVLPVSASGWLIVACVHARVTVGNGAEKTCQISKTLISRVAELGEFLVLAALV